jgi:hypothetical protein
VSSTALIRRSPNKYFGITEFIGTTSQAEAATSATQYGNKVLMDINTYSQALQQFELPPYFVFIVGRRAKFQKD